MRPFPRYTYPAKNRHSAKLIVLPPSPKNGAPRQLSPINPSIPRIHLKPLPAQHRVLNSVPKHVANNYRDVVPRNPASCLCFSATEPNFHLKREKERKKKKKRKKKKEKAKTSSFGRRERFRFAAVRYATTTCCTSAQQRERAERKRNREEERERRCRGGPFFPRLESSRRGAESEGAAISGSSCGGRGSGAEEGSTARWRGPWRQTGGRAPALARRVSRQSGPHLPAKTQLPFRHRPRDTNRPSAFPVSLSPTESRHRKGHASDSTGLYYLFRHSFAFFSFLFLFLSFAQLSPD